MPFSLITLHPFSIPCYILFILLPPPFFPIFYFSLLSLLLPPRLSLFLSCPSPRVFSSSLSLISFLSLYILILISSLISLLHFRPLSFPPCFSSLPNPHSLSIISIYPFSPSPPSSLSLFLPPYSLPLLFSPSLLSPSTPWMLLPIEIWASAPVTCPGDGWLPPLFAHAFSPSSSRSHLCLPVFFALNLSSPPPTRLSSFPHYLFSLYFCLVFFFCGGSSNFFCRVLLLFG